ncbi:putative V-type ATP synthase subunit F [Desulfosarcina variabilis str. Montpellier]|uniref:V-type ATP synthase subunit F n=1 Tax=Desulfosarcina variabilis TaxID=2300 RepID=UPI003AFA1B8F
MKIHVIADRDTVLAFRLAGVEGHVVHVAAEVSERVDQLCREETGLILITEGLFDENRERLEPIMLAPGGTLILPIPAFKGPMPRKAGSTDRIAAFLRR